MVRAEAPSGEERALGGSTVAASTFDEKDVMLRRNSHQGSDSTVRGKDFLRSRKLQSVLVRMRESRKQNASIGMGSKGNISPIEERRDDSQGDPPEVGRGVSPSNLEDRESGPTDGELSLREDVPAKLEEIESRPPRPPPSHLHDLLETRAESKALRVIPVSYGTHSSTGLARDQIRGAIRQRVYQKLQRQREDEYMEGNPGHSNLHNEDQSKTSERRLVNSEDYAVGYSRTKRRGSHHDDPTRDLDLNGHVPFKGSQKKRSPLPQNIQDPFYRRRKQFDKTATLSEWDYNAAEISPNRDHEGSFPNGAEDRQDRRQDPSRVVFFKESSSSGSAEEGSTLSREEASTSSSSAYVSHSSSSDYSDSVQISVSQDSMQMTGSNVKIEPAGFDRNVTASDFVAAIVRHLRLHESFVQSDAGPYGADLLGGRAYRDASVDLAEFEGSDDGKSKQRTFESVPGDRDRSYTRDTTASLRHVTSMQDAVIALGQTKESPGANTTENSTISPVVTESVVVHLMEGTARKDKLSPDGQKAEVASPACGVTDFLSWPNRAGRGVVGGDHDDSAAVSETEQPGTSETSVDVETQSMQTARVTGSSEQGGACGAVLSFFAKEPRSVAIDVGSNNAEGNTDAVVDSVVSGTAEQTQNKSASRTSTPSPNRTPSSTLPEAAAAPPSVAVADAPVLKALEEKSVASLSYSVGSTADPSPDVLLERALSWDNSLKTLGLVGIETISNGEGKSNLKQEDQAVANTAVVNGGHLVLKSAASGLGMEVEMLSVTAEAPCSNAGLGSTNSCNSGNSGNSVGASSLSKKVLLKPANSSGEGMEMEAASSSPVALFEDDANGAASEHNANEDSEASARQVSILDETTNGSHQGPIPQNKDDLVVALSLSVNSNEGAVVREEDRVQRTSANNGLDEHQNELRAKIYEFQQRRSVSATKNVDGERDAPTQMGSGVVTDPSLENKTERPHMLESTSPKSWPRLPQKLPTTGKKIAQAYVDAIAKKKSLEQNQAGFVRGQIIMLDSRYRTKTESKACDVQPASPASAPDITGDTSLGNKSKTVSNSAQVDGGAPIGKHRGDQVLPRDTATVGEGQNQPGPYGFLDAITEEQADTVSIAGRKAESIGRGSASKDSSSASRHGQLSANPSDITKRLAYPTVSSSVSVSNDSLGGGSAAHIDDLVSKIDGVVHRLIKSGKLQLSKDSLSQDGDLGRRQLQTNTSELLRNLAILRARRSFAESNGKDETGQTFSSRGSDVHRSLSRTGTTTHDRSLPETQKRTVGLWAPAKTDTHAASTIPTPPIDGRFREGLEDTTTSGQGRTNTASGNDRVVLLRARRDEAAKIIQKGRFPAQPEGHVPLGKNTATNSQMSSAGKGSRDTAQQSAFGPENTTSKNGRQLQEIENNSRNSDAHERLALDVIDLAGSDRVENRENNESSGGKRSSSAARGKKLPPKPEDLSDRKGVRATRGFGVSKVSNVTPVALSPHESTEGSNAGEEEANTGTGTVPSPTSGPGTKKEHVHSGPKMQDWEQIELRKLPMILNSVTSNSHSLSERSEETENSSTVDDSSADSGSDGDSGSEIGSEYEEDDEDEEEEDDDESERLRRIESMIQELRARRKYQGS